MDDRRQSFAGAVEDARREQAQEGGTSIEHKIQQRLQAKPTQRPGKRAKQARPVLATFALFACPFTGVPLLLQLTCKLPP